MHKSSSQADTPLPLTPSVRTGPSNGPARFTPAARWVAEEQIKVLCILVAIISPLIALFFLQRGTANLRAGIWAYSVDGTGAIHYGPVTQADAKSALFREILLQAAQAYYTRNPSGLSYPEIARRIFVGDSWKKLDLELRDELPERKRRNLYDHPEVEAIDPLDENGSSLRYRIRGFIVRSGAVEGLPFEPPPGEFHLIVELSPQKDGLLQGRYPFVVTSHNAAARWPAASP